MRGWGGIYTQPPKTSPLGWFLRPCRIFWHVQKDLQNSNFNSQAQNFQQRVGTCNCELEHSQSPWEDPHRNFRRGSEVPTVSRNMHSVRNISPEPVGTLDRNFRQRPEVPTQCRNMYLFLGWLTEPLGTSISEVPTECRIFWHTQRQCKLKMSCGVHVCVWNVFISKLKSC